MTLEMVCSTAVALQQQEKWHAHHWRVVEALDYLGGACEGGSDHPTGRLWV